MASGNRTRTDAIRPEALQGDVHRRAKAAHGKTAVPRRHYGEGGSETSENAEEKANGKPRRYRNIKPKQDEMRHVANSLRVGDSVGMREPAAPATRYPTDSGTRLLGPSRTTITRAAPCGATHKEQLMAFPKHPIIDVTPARRRRDSPSRCGALHAALVRQARREDG